MRCDGQGDDGVHRYRHRRDARVRVRALLTGGLDQGPHITLKVGGAYSLNVPEVTRRLRWEGFATAGVQTTALWCDRSGQSRTSLKDRQVLSV